jgi:hypothetical protein
MCIKIQVEKGGVIYMCKPIGITGLLEIKNPWVPWSLESECNVRKGVAIIVSEVTHVHICKAVAHVEWNLVHIKGEYSLVSPNSL